MCRADIADESLMYTSVTLQRVGQEGGSGGLKADLFSMDRFFCLLKEGKFNLHCF